MSPALRALVAADQQRPGASDIERRRVYAAMGVSLGVIPAGALVAAHAAAATATAAPGGATTLATAVGAASTFGRIALVIKAPLVSVGVGALLGATLTAYVVKGPAARWTASARARRAAVTAIAAPPVARPGAPAIYPVGSPVGSPIDEVDTKAATVAPPVIVEAPSAVAPSAVAPPRAHHVAAAQTAISKDRTAERASDDSLVEAPVASADTLAAEQALLDPARAALAHGDGADALTRLATHERRFPSGALAQEREAMTIRGLTLVGDRDRARLRAASFRARYPGSLLWPMIVSTLNFATLNDDATPGGSAHPIH